MYKGNLTREQVVALVGLAIVEKIEAENCSPTNRVGYNGTCQGDNEVEFSAAVNIPEDDYGNVHGNMLIAYYYQYADDVDNCDGDLSMLDWSINGYEII